MLPDQERKLYLQRLRRLERLGLAMPFEYHFLNSQPLEIDVAQCASELDCPVIELPDKQTLFVVWLEVWAERPGIRLYDFRFEPPWRDHAFLRLPNFADSHVGAYYCLPHGLEYPREEVLNLNFLTTGWRLPSTRVEGVLCGLSDTPIPEKFKHGASVPVGVKFFDRSGQHFAAASVVLWADRWHAPAVTRPAVKPLVTVDGASAGVAG